MKKSTLIGVISCAVTFVTLLIIASFFDLQINVALGNADSLFGQFFRLWGESTGWIVIPIAGAFLFGASNKKCKSGKIMSIIWAVITLIGWILTIKYFLEEFTGDSYSENKYGSPYKFITIYSVVFALIISGMHLWSATKIKKEILSKLVIFAITMIIALAISQIVTTVLKNIWTRQRFRNLDIGNGGTDSSGFTPWYKPGFGKNRDAATHYVEDSAGMMKEDAYKSFPSGHTSAAAMSFVIIMLPDIFEKLKKFKVWFYVVPSVYTVLVALSRIVNRAHYLSDVLFGATIGILSVYAAIGIADLIRKKCKTSTKLQKAALTLGAYDEPISIDNDGNTEE